MPTKKKATKINVTLVKSLIGSTDEQRAVVKSLGLGKVQSAKTHNASPQVNGMIKKVSHLLLVEEV